MLFRKWDSCLVLRVPWISFVMQGSMNPVSLWSSGSSMIVIPLLRLQFLPSFAVR